MPRGGKRTTSFKKGQSGNPTGKPKDPIKNQAIAQARQAAQQAILDLKVAARELTPRAVERLKEILENDYTHPTTMIKAVEITFDRGWGKPKETTDITVRASLEELVLASFKPKKRDED